MTFDIGLHEVCVRVGALRPRGESSANRTEGTYSQRILVEDCTILRYHLVVLDWMLLYTCNNLIGTKMVSILTTLVQFK